MPDYEVVLKTIQPITVASIRETLPKYAAVGGLFNELYDYLYRNEVKPENYCAAIWHDAGYKATDVDAESVVSVDKLYQFRLHRNDIEDTAVPFPYRQ